MTNTGNTFKGTNGSFTSVYYKRSGEWVPGVQDNATGKRVYHLSVRSSYAAAQEAERLARIAAGDDAQMILA